MGSQSKSGDQEPGREEPAAASPQHLCTQSIGSTRLCVPQTLNKYKQLDFLKYAMIAMMIIARFKL